MKNNLGKILLSVLAAAAVACSMSACGEDTEPAGNDISDESTVSSEITEESEESFVVPKTESTEEESEAESSAEDLNYGDITKFVGEWDFRGESEYVFMTLKEDGSVEYISDEYDTVVAGTWAMEEDKVKVTVKGKDYTFSYINNSLQDYYTPGHTFTKPKTETSKQESKPKVGMEYTGQWRRDVGSGYVLMTITDDGKVQLTSPTGQTASEGSWKIEKNKLKVTLDGEDSFYTLKSDTLTDTANSAYVFFKSSDLVSEVSNLPSKYVGLWHAGSDSNYINITLESDGTVTYVTPDGEEEKTEQGTWVMDGENIKITLESGDSYYTADNDMLINRDNGIHVFFKRS